ncbi:hypothetical protein G7085_04120 [Tessaracoccus sp. HDW20]|uniref:hypothetical protein n=1 Tax=Tessaracoccus coleopterorum TaxID=2714950 RepID=UPI0018D32B98|nr:hypothetical protein [Tessaracoccus coleopterorum]NHB84102.1 hypothetical protein [Tessaracoccus coleopterorum]
MATHDAGWTDGERESMDEVCWMAVEVLEEVGIEVFPPELPGLVRQLAAGWDGACRRLGESPRSLSSQ